MGKALVYRVLHAAEWHQFTQTGQFLGSLVDIQDGYIHFSHANQVVETVKRHYSGRRDLVLVAVEASRLGPALLDEPSRGGALFPHLYAPLPIEAVLWHRAFTCDETGAPVLPALE
jgi:uncharacterized protein (DUF952 family)